MSKYIHNEGRVVGYSAYEIYVMQHAYTVPDINAMPPATEREWLAASLGAGASMLLKLRNLAVPSGQSYGYVQIPLPSTTNLCAANTIVASFFDGVGNFEGASTAQYDWATSVIDYGQLISNTEGRSPEEDATDLSTAPLKVPYQAIIGDLSEAKMNELKDYMHIIDGITLQPGTFTENSSTLPAKLLSPDLTKYPVIRLKYSKAINETTILLTGFTNRAVIAGETGFPLESEVSERVDATGNPQNGDFLGPEAFPWANKIIFSVPTSFMHHFLESNYARTLGTSDSIVVDDDAIIDMKNSQASSYYGSNFTNSPIDFTVDKLNVLGSGAASLVLYSRRGANGPSGLYEARVEDEGAAKMYPVDVVAPGTVKIYTFDEGDVSSDISARIKTLETDEVDNLGFARRASDYTIFQRTSDDGFIPIADIENDGTLVTTTVGNKSTKSLAMEDADGTEYFRDTPPNNDDYRIQPQRDEFYWKILLQALHEGKAIDILGALLKDFKSHLPNIESEGVLKLTGTAASSVGGSFTSGGAITAGGRVKSGTNYIVFENGETDLRLYISPTKPSTSGVPVGSIGIGWTE